MFAYLQGKIAAKSANELILDVQGVGFELNCSMNTLTNVPQVGEDARLYTILNVKEDLMELYGFATLEEKQMFTRLTSVSGVGPKTALQMLSSMPLKDLTLAIMTGDTAVLARAQGIGKKTAQRIALELKEKVGELEVDAFGEVGHYEDKGIRKRALVAVGRVDYGDPFNLTPCMEGVEVIGASSDHTILDVTDAKEEIRVGDVLVFRVKYSNLVYLSNTESVQIRYSE